MKKIIEKLKGEIENRERSMKPYLNDSRPPEQGYCNECRNIIKGLRFAIDLLEKEAPLTVEELYEYVNKNITWCMMDSDGDIVTNGKVLNTLSELTKIVRNEK